SKESLSKDLGLRGVWQKSLMVKDAIIAVAVSFGGACLLYSWFTQSMSAVAHQ
nr:6K2 [Sunflower ring blotch virus]